jgi:heterotetrameric sarcosine oxidase gamma subunit
MPKWSRRRSSTPRAIVSMDDSRDTGRHAGTAVEIDGLSVTIEQGLQIASLRYFDAAGGFAATVRETIGRPLPEPLQVSKADGATSDADIMLAWRSPTETLLLGKDGAAFAQLERRLASAQDGCMVDQTGGIRVLRLQGRRAGDLLLRLGAATAIPGLGEARSGRLAELHVLTACVRAGQYLLLVERVYAKHLLDWIGATAADFDAAHP